MKNQVQQHAPRKQPAISRAADSDHAPKTAQPDAPVQTKRNQTGLPDNLKSGIESLSGHSMDDVKVHYNSSQPAGLQAHAYAQGSDIHVAPGQERHLPHEAWHVVQQKQGRVKPTRQLKGKTPVNDDAGLEHEADVMGSKALAPQTGNGLPLQMGSVGNTVQRKPSVFAVHAQQALDLEAGGDEKSKSFHSWVSGIELLDKSNIFSTPWTLLRKALQKYTQLPDDPVGPEHLEAIVEVQNAIDKWKTGHKVGEKDLDEDENQKWQAIQAIETVLPDEIQFSRQAKQAPKSNEEVVTKHLEFIFQDALGEPFVEYYSRLLWEDYKEEFDSYQPGDGQLDGDNLEGLGAHDIYMLAGKWAESRNFEMKIRCSMANSRVNGFGRIANVEVDLGEYLKDRAQHILLHDVIKLKIAPTYPEMAKELKRRIKDGGITGFNSTEVFTTTANAFMTHAPTSVETMDAEELDRLRHDIRNSNEYILILQVTCLHDQGPNEAKGSMLPESMGEDMGQREQFLLGNLQFESQKRDKDDNILQEGGVVPALKKEQIVLALMTLEKLMGRPFSSYPRFVLVKKQGSKYRANADVKSNKIHYDYDFEIRTAVHELGHFYENQTTLGNWYNVYLMMRSRHTQNAQRLEKNEGNLYSNSLPHHLEEPGFLGGLNFKEHRYYSEYTGRYYETGHTEMMSMFTERLINRQKVEDMIDNDPQGFAVLLKALRPNSLPGWDLGRLGFRQD